MLLAPNTKWDVEKIPGKHFETGKIVWNAGYDDDDDGWWWLMIEVRKTRNENSVKK